MQEMEFRKLQTVEVRKGLKQLREQWCRMVDAPSPTIDQLLWYHQPFMTDSAVTLAEYVVNFIHGGHARRALKKGKAREAAPLRIGFGSQSRVGKDSAAEHLAARHGGVRLSFAKPIYDIMHDVQARLGLPREKDPEFLQAVGQWACRRNPYVWVDKLVGQLEDLPPSTNVFVTDVRKEAEATALRQRGFRLVRIVRPDRPIDRDPTHATETGLQDDAWWDAVVVNDGTLEELHAKVDALVAAEVEARNAQGGAADQADA
jgi:hypothetical protein